MLVRVGLDLPAARLPTQAMQLHSLSSVSTDTSHTDPSGIAISFGSLNESAEYSSSTSSMERRCQVGLPSSAVSISMSLTVPPSSLGATNPAGCERVVPGRRLVRSHAVQFPCRGRSGSRRVRASVAALNAADPDVRSGHRISGGGEAAALDCESSTTHFAPST